MINASVNFATLFLAALVAGTMFALWLGRNPNELSAATYVEHQQQLIRGLNIAMPILGAMTIALAIASAVLEKNHASRILFAAAALAFIASGLITRFCNQPINVQVMKWHAQTLPPDWSALRDEWWRWHRIRTVTGLIGLALVLAAQVSKAA